MNNINCEKQADCKKQSEQSRKTGRIVLLRHGQTPWSVSGQHTGRTNIPLTDTGCEQAKAAGERLRKAFPNGFARVCVSPLRRAQQTAQLAGFHGETLDDMAEWDYGQAEGLTRQYVAEHLGEDDWVVWRQDPSSLPETLTESLGSERDEVLPNGETVHIRAGRGESLEEIAARADNVIAEVKQNIEKGEDVLLVAHGHFLQILTAQWIGVEPSFAGSWLMNTAQFAILDYHNGQPVITKWNA